jgi:hypothetical protein
MPKMSKKDLAKAREREQMKQRIQGATAFALVSAPTPFSWEKTVSVDILVKEVRNFLGIAKRYTAQITRAIRQALADWTSFGVIHDKEKDCVTLKKEAESRIEAVATSYAFA